MTAQGTPRGFDLDRQNAVVRVEHVMLHHRLEADADGRLQKHVWIEAEAVPTLDRDTMTMDLHFILWTGDERLGKCCAHGVEIDGERESLAVVADSALRIAQNTDVSKIELKMKVTTVNSFAAVKLDPAPFPASDQGA